MKRKMGILSLVFIVLITGCSPVVVPVFNTDDLSSNARATAQVAIQATLDAVPTQVNHEATIAQADASNGELLFNMFQSDAGFACSTCHLVNTDNQLIGPGLLTISERAETRIEGQSAYEYVLTSVVNPDDYIVENFSMDLMPENWAGIYSEDEINDIIAYLWTLNQ